MADALILIKVTMFFRPNID